MYTITLKSIKELRKLLSCRNQILIKRKYKNEEQRTESGIFVTTDSTFRPALHADRIGEVVLVPPGLYYHHRSYRHYHHGGEAMPWDCTMELQVGDIVVHTFMDRDDIVNIEVEDEPGELYRMMPYDDIYVAKRKIIFDVWTSAYIKSNTAPWVMINGVKYGAQKEGEDNSLHAIIPLNGYCLCEEVMKESMSEVLDIIQYDKNDNLEDPIDKQVGKVAYVGKPNRAYRGDGHEYLWDDGVEVNVGDVIIKRRSDIHIRLEEDLHNRFFDSPKMYFIIQRKDIYGIKN